MTKARNVRRGDEIRMNIFMRALSVEHLAGDLVRIRAAVEDAPSVQIEGSCTVECVEATDCGKGQCTSTGRCDEIVLDPPMTDPTPLEENPKCIEGQVEFKAVVPQVWLLLDRSGSMTGALGAVTRWAALGSVLLGDPIDPTDRGVVGAWSARSSPASALTQLRQAAVLIVTRTPAGAVELADVDGVSEAQHGCQRLRNE